MSLQKTTYFSLIGTCIYFWLFLFLPAGSWHYWQAWIFWIAFTLPTTFITVYFLHHDPELMASRLKAGPMAEKQKGQKIIQFFASISFILLLVFPGLDFRFHWSVVPVPLIWLGNLGVVLGLGIVFFVFKENSFTSATIEVGKKQTVISTGPYHYVRHPMYSGALLMILCMPIALGSWWALLFVMPMVLIIVLRLLDEEKYLLKNLTGYPDYYHKTNYRLLPFIW